MTARAGARIVFDLDGVLVDLVGGALQFHGSDIPRRDVRWDFMDQIGFAGRHDEFWDSLTADFWSGLEPLEDGMSLLSEVRLMAGVSGFCVCTSPPTSGASSAILGKAKWVNSHLPFVDLRDVAYLSNKSLMARRDAVLIDDNESNVNEYRQAGGPAVLVPRPWNARRAECMPDGHSFDVLAVVREVHAYVEAARRAAAAGGNHG